MTDWLPILIKSGLTLNKLPDAHGVCFQPFCHRRKITNDNQNHYREIYQVVSWVPMDAVTSTVLDTAFLNDRAPIAVNVVHPRPISWSVVMRNIRHALVREKSLSPEDLTLIPFQQWVLELEKHVNSSSDDLVSYA